MFSFGLWNTRGDKQQNTAEEKGKGQRPMEKRWSQVPTPPPNPHSQPNQPARRADEATTTRAGKVHGSTSANVRARTGSRDLLRPPEPELRKCRCSAGAAAFRTPEVQWPALPMRRNSPKSSSSKRAFAAHRTLFRPPACEFCGKEFEQIPLDSAPTLPVRIGLRLDLGTTSHARMPVARSDGIR